MKANAITRRNIIPALLLTLGLLLPALLPAVGRAQCDVCAGPVTTRVTWHVPNAFSADASSGFWLSGLSGAPRQVPDVLGIAWMPVPNSWFGTVWRIILTSGAELIPTTLRPQNDQGFLQNQQMLELVTLPPAPGHTYKAQLSYDPGTGATALSIYDVTADQTVLADGWQLLPYSGPVFAPIMAIADVAPPDMSVPALITTETWDHFVPAPIYWRLIDTGTSPATVAQALRRDRAVALEVDTSWTRLPGHLHLRIVSPAAQEFSVPIDTLSGNAQTPLPINDLAAGVYRFVLEYREGDQVITLGERDYPIGVVQVDLLHVNVRQLGAERADISGTLRLQADGPVQSAYVSLLAELDSLGFTVDPAGMEGKISSGDLTTTLIEQWMLPQIDQKQVDLPFTAEVNLPCATWTPYQLVQLTLRPLLQTGAQLDALPYTQRLRLTPTKLPQQTKMTDELRVMSYNIHAGRGMDNVLDLQRIADEIAYSGSDIIGLNEVDRLTVRSGWVDQAAALADMLGMYFAFGSNINYQGGQYGNAVLSRYPILNAVNHHLPFIDGERRGILHAEIDCAGTTVHFLVTHLGLTAEESTLQLEQVVKLTESISGPVILVGDFNRRAGTELDPIFHLGGLLQDAWLLGASLNTSSGGGTVTPVYSNFVPDRRIDYVWISPTFSIRQPGDVFTIASLASDHRPVVAHLHLQSDGR